MIQPDASERRQYVDLGTPETIAPRTCSVWGVLFVCISACAAHADIPVDFVAQWGGPSDAVTVVGNIAYLGVGQHLNIVDVADPTNPVFLGQTQTFPDQVRGVCVSGSFAFVAAANAGLVVIDVSDPTAPTQVGAYDTNGYSFDVVVVGNYAYVADAGNGLEIIDVGVSSNPTRVGGYDTGGEARKVTVVGTYAYVGDGFGGLTIIDVSTPTAPTLAGSVLLPDYAMGVALAGDYAYVADGYNGGLQVVDVTDPSHPEVVGGCTTDAVPSDVMVDGDYAFVANAWLGLAVIDIWEPGDPVKVNDYAAGPWIDDLFLTGGKVYLAEHARGLQIIEVSQAPNATFTGRYRPSSGEVTDLNVEGNYLYLSDGTGGGGLQVLDVTDRMAPVWLGGVDTHEFAWGMTYHGGYVYLADGCAGLGIIDVTNPANPSRLGEVATGCAARDVVVQGNYAYVALDGGHGLTIVNVQDPHAPVIAGHWVDSLNPGYALGVAVAGTLACLADDLQGLQIIDVLDPADPTRVGRFQTGGPVRDVALAENLAYVVDEWTGLHVVDLTDPATPYEIGQAGFGGGTGITLAGHYACVAAGGDGVQIVDISDAANPALVGWYNTPGSARRVAVAGNSLYVADFYNGLVILNAPLAVSDDYYWVNPLGGEFAWPDNWNPAGPPGPSHRAIFDLPSMYDVTLPPDADTTNDRLLVNDGQVGLNLNGRVYTLQHVPDGQPALAIADDPSGLAIADLSVFNGDLDITLQSEAGLVIGRTGEGSLTVRDSGNVHNAGMVHVAETNGSFGYLALLNVGIAGGTLTSNYKMLVGMEGGSGVVDVDGYGSQLAILGRDPNNAGDLVSLELGYHGGHGTMNVTGGGQVSVPYGGQVQTGIVTVGGTGPGELTVEGDGSLLDAQFVLEVGRDADGTMTVRNGGQVSISGFAPDGGYTWVGLRMPGEVTVTGENSRLTMNSQLSVGGGHYGALTISDHGTGQCAVLVVGDTTDAPTEGHVVVTGAGSSLTTTLCRVASQSPGTLLVTDGASLTDTSQAQVGYAAHGKLDITAGGHVTSYKGTSATGSSSIIAWQAGSLGEVKVSGPDSTWTQNGVASVGWSGEGYLTVEDSGQVKSAAGTIARLAGSTGTATVTGATSKWIVDDWLSVGGLMDTAGGAGALNVNNDGLVTAGTGLRVWSGGALTLDGGRVVVGTGPETAAANTLALYTGGMLSGSGTITGRVENVSGQVIPGVSTGTLPISGNYIQAVAGSLEIEIGGTSSGQFDVLNITGNAALAGTLRIALSSGFVPAAGDSFGIVHASGACSGKFTWIAGQHAADGLRFLPNYSTHSVVLTVVPVVPPDFDRDGDVDSDDLNAFESCASGPGIPLQSGSESKDLDHDGDVDQSDFAIFQRCFSGPDVPADPNCAK